MTLTTLLASLLFCSPALAGGDGVVDESSADGVSSQAEYVRLSDEMEKLATRNAWAGVERIYATLQAAGHALTFEDHVRGAHAARAVGNVGGVRHRLEAANQAKAEDRETIDWMWDIDSKYGKVRLACDLGTGVTLEIEQMPFNPDHQRAVEYGRTQIAEECLLEGYLPAGTYTFGGETLEVQPRVSTLNIDLQDGTGGKRKKRKAKKDKG